MNTSTKTTRISAVFLAAILVAGTIALSSPSFMNSAEAITMDNNNFQKKSFGKDVSVKYVKCNNINVNVNGFELDINRASDIFGSQLAAEEAETGASSFGGNSGFGGGSSNGPYGSDKKDSFVFVCINNNNNAGGGGGGDTTDCEECFQGEALAEFRAAVEAGIDINIPGTSLSVTIDSLAEVCAILDFLGSADNLDTLLNVFLNAANVDLDSADFEELLICVAAALGIELPPTV
jgi:hypothetical protein